VCGGRYAITNAGLLYKHTRACGAAAPGHAHVPFVIETCPGSGTEPTGFSRKLRESLDAIPQTGDTP